MFHKNYFNWFDGPDIFIVWVLITAAAFLQHVTVVNITETTQCVNENTNNDFLYRSDKNEDVSLVWRRWRRWGGVGVKPFKWSLTHKNNKGDLCCEAVTSISDKLPQWGVNAASLIHDSVSASCWTAEMSPPAPPRPLSAELVTIR